MRLGRPQWGLVPGDPGDLRRRGQPTSDLQATAGDQGMQKTIGLSSLCESASIDPLDDQLSEMFIDSKEFIDPEPAVVSGIPALTATFSTVEGFFRNRPAHRQFG